MSNDDLAITGGPADGTAGDRTALGSELRDLAAALAVEAGELIESMRTEVDMTGDTKSSATDVVTAADKASEAFIMERLLAARPDDSILGEEGGDVHGTSGVRWLIDPIDGTTNYVYDIPAYSVSIAAEFQGEMVAGVVYEPKSNTCYDAAIGDGARRNGQPISCTDKDELATALVATGFGYSPERRAGQAGVLVSLLPDVRDIRRFGSAALDLCAVADGRVDAYYEKGLNPWDLAAGWLIATEAGALAGDLRGGPPSPDFVIAAGPGLFDLLRDRLADQGADRLP